MKILITNDDGIHSTGLIALTEEISKIANVVVVAPDRERSATSHSITMHKPLRVNETSIPTCNVPAWMINGTPSDCVKIAMEAILDYTPDMILSGINRGPNLGTDVFYSGTVSAAIEGAMLGIPAMALSVVGHRENFSFVKPAILARSLCLQLSKLTFPKDALLNVNIPSVSGEEIKGIAITRLGKKRYTNNFDRRVDPRGKVYYWLAGESIEDINDVDSDVWAVGNNYISITPMLFDLTKFDAIKDIKTWNLHM